eukprot:TRINITY_DN36153_c0_g1_i1.p1 TRINITY_DN36153_c0_g1~~TRINITY_DN36153_c0_g1_i1.p1  ORF type:complete len:272 (+),score=78.64 TRINITY_DN36153_c0_g1_i1:40-816(+)
MEPCSCFRSSSSFSRLDEDERAARDAQAWSSAAAMTAAATTAAATAARRGDSSGRLLPSTISGHSENKAVVGGAEMPSLGDGDEIRYRGKSVALDAESGDIRAAATSESSSHQQQLQNEQQEHNTELQQQQKGVEQRQQQLPHSGGHQLQAQDQQQGQQLQPYGVERQSEELRRGRRTASFDRKQAQEELDLLFQAKEAGVVYLLSQAHVEARASAGWGKRLVINHLYAFLKRNFRDRSGALGIPKASLVEVGMAYVV